jgi:hypothetical protein
MEGSVTPRRLDHLLNICPGFDGSFERIEDRQPRLLTVASRIRGHECFEFFRNVDLRNRRRQLEGLGGGNLFGRRRVFFSNGVDGCGVGLDVTPPFAKPLWLSKGGFWIS